jgi:exopolysaccharide biosynthesis polyprenyl glycosylphosphotransferase
MITLLVLDMLLLVAARWIAEAYGTNWSELWNVQENRSLIILILTLDIGLLIARGMYKSGSRRRDYFGIFKSLTLANILLLLIAYLHYPEELVSRSTFLLSWFLSVAFVCAGRWAINGIVRFVRTYGGIQSPVFAFCRPQDADKVAALLDREDSCKLAGWADIEQLKQENLQTTLEQLDRLGISGVYVCAEAIQDPMLLYWNLRNAGMTLYILPIGLEPLFRESEFSIVSGVPCLRYAPPAVAGVDFWIKRICDFFLAVMLLMVAAPLYLAIAVLIKLDSPGPIFYRQTRMGLHSRPFKVWKFRTMVSNADQLQKQLEAQNETKDGVLFKIKNDPRITRIGGFLRRYSLDELPQVFNILLGEMSFVGPRPLPMRDIEKFAEHHFIRHEVLPGITGLWQVSGRSDIDNFEEVLRLDIRYVENWSLWLDLRIILATVQVILQKTGAY